MATPLNVERARCEGPEGIGVREEVTFKEHIKGVFKSGHAWTLTVTQ